MALIEHLEKLRHFYKISQYNSINETSQKTGFSQAGLSKSLKLLELELGCNLFKRSRTGLSLTKEGLEVLATTKIIINQTATLENRLRSLKVSKFPENIKIGMYDSIAIYFGIDLNEYLNAIYPDVQLILSANSSALLVNKIRENSLDIAIGVNFHKINSSKMTYFALFEDNYSYYISPKLFNSEINNSLIIHDSATDENGKSIEELFQKDFKDKNIHTVVNFETLKQLVAGGFGIGILPSLVAKPLLNSGEIIHYLPSKSKKFIGKHNIGILVRNETLKNYKEFILDIIRLGERWIKT